MTEKENWGLEAILKSYSDKIAEFKKAPESKWMEGYEKNVQKRLEDERKFWEYQSTFNPIDRVKAFSSLFKKYKLEYESASEKDFIIEELKKHKRWLDIINQTNNDQKRAYYHIKRYVEHLEKLYLDVIEDESNIKDKKDRKLAFTLNRVETVAFMTLLMDAGLIVHTTDYALARFMEKHLLYEIDKPLKHIRSEISELRRLEKDPKKYEDHIKNILSNASIKTNDDL